MKLSRQYWIFLILSLFSRRKLSSQTIYKYQESVKFEQTICKLVDCFVVYLVDKGLIDWLIQIDKKCTTASCKNVLLIMLRLMCSIFFQSNSSFFLHPLFCLLPSRFKLLYLFYLQSICILEIYQLKFIHFWINNSSINSKALPRVQVLLWSSVSLIILSLDTCQFSQYILYSCIHLSITWIPGLYILTRQPRRLAPPCPVHSLHFSL